jgi:predicted RNase H-like HicB family nuclease
MTELPGVWATGKTFEDCRNELISVIEGWIALRLRLGDPIPPLGSHTTTASDRFHGMMKIPRKLADEIIDMEMWD